MDRVVEREAEEACISVVVHEETEEADMHTYRNEIPLMPLKHTENVTDVKLAETHTYRTYSDALTFPPSPQRKHMHTHTLVYTSASFPPHTNTLTSTHTNTHMYTNTYAHMYKHTHAHTQTKSFQ